MERSFEVDAALMAISQSLIDESRRLLASLRGGRAALENNALLNRSRTLIAESRQLLATLEQIPVPLTPSQSTGGDHKPGLSVRVFQTGSIFGWMLTSPTNEMLGRGTAETELKARIDAFRAGMTYIDRSKSRSAPKICLH